MALGQVSWLTLQSWARTFHSCDTQRTPYPSNLGETEGSTYTFVLLVPHLLNTSYSKNAFAKRCCHESADKPLLSDQQYV